MGQTPAFHFATTSFLCRTYNQVCGANWVIIGEAASQSDPITGNGVTAALRHAEEAVALINRHLHRGTIPVFARRVYDRRVRSVGLYFNSLIEKIFYQPMLRDRLGLFGTARVYTVPAWLMNLIYSRMSPAALDSNPCNHCRDGFAARGHLGGFSNCNLFLPYSRQSTD